MSILFDADGLAFDLSNYDFDGNELVYSTNPVVFLDARGRLASLVASGALAGFRKTGTLASLHSAGALAYPLHAAGSKVTYTTHGALPNYAVTGVLEGAPGGSGWGAGGWGNFGWGV